MAIFYIDNSKQSSYINYGFYGYDSNDQTKSLSLGLFNTNTAITSQIIDGPDTDKVLASGEFSHNNTRGIIARQTPQLSTVDNKVIINMSNNDLYVEKTYPDQDKFGQPDTLQYIYSNNPRKDKIGVF